MPVDPSEQYDALMEEFERLCRPVYAGLLSGELRADDVVALACAALEVNPAPAIREVVEQSEIGAERLAELARAVLDEVGFEPGFDTPGRLERLQQALRTVARDLPNEIDATALRLRAEASGNPEPRAVVGSRRAGGTATGSRQARATIRSQRCWEWPITCRRGSWSGCGPCGRSAINTVAESSRQFARRWSCGTARPAMSSPRWASCTVNTDHRSLDRAA
jgi:hypothetical protein